MQSGECFGCVGNSSERLRDKLVSLGLGRKHEGVDMESDELIACCTHDSDNVGELTSDFSSSCVFSSCTCSTVTVGVGSFFGLFFN